MIHVWKKEDMKFIQGYLTRAVESVGNVINILDENYGCNRKSTDDGGCVYN